jgi:hypothetical protein
MNRQLIPIAMITKSSRLEGCKDTTGLEIVRLTAIEGLELEEINKRGANDESERQ